MAKGLKKRYRLSGMSLDETSVVTVGAHQDADIVLFKLGEEESKLSKFLKGVAENLGMEFDQSFLAEQPVTGDTVHKEDADMDIDFDTLEPDVRTYIEKLEERIAKMEDEKDEMESKDESDEEKDEMEKSDVLAKLDPEVRKMVEDAQTRAEQAEAIAKAERDARVTAEFISKAEALSELSVNPTEFGPVLKAAAETLDPEQYAEIERVLKAANEAVASAGMWNEFGKTTVTPSTTEAKIDTLAKSLQAQDPALSYEAAYTKALEQNPGLYTEALNEGVR